MNANMLRQEGGLPEGKQQNINKIYYILLYKVWCFMYYLKNKQECFIRFKATSAQREWL